MKFPRWRRFAMACGLAGIALAGCHRDMLPLPETRSGGNDSGTTSEQLFVPDSFDQLYPLFLTRRLTPNTKAALWHKYQGKWIRWTGVLVSFSRDGLTFKHIPNTLTFDVSLQITPEARPKLAHLKLGDRVTYIGRLDTYDDVLRTFYLVHGDVVIPNKNG
jgi:hypothetical protein